MYRNIPQHLSGQLQYSNSYSTTASHSYEGSCFFFFFWGVYEQPWGGLASRKITDTPQHIGRTGNLSKVKESSIQASIYQQEYGGCSLHLLLCPLVWYMHSCILYPVSYRISYILYPTAQLIPLIPIPVRNKHFLGKDIKRSRGLAMAPCPQISFSSTTSL